MAGQILNSVATVKRELVSLDCRTGSLGVPDALLPPPPGSPIPKPTHPRRGGAFKPKGCQGGLATHGVPLRVASRRFAAVRAVEVQELRRQMALLDPVRGAHVALAPAAVQVA